MRKFNKPIILASKSPRRKEILSSLGYEFHIMVSSKEEVFNNKLSLSDALKDVALQKAYDVKNEHNIADSIIISADTIVYINNEILGKPKDHQDAVRMLKLIQGTKHFVLTAVAVVTDDKVLVDVEQTAVYFKTMTDDEILNYIEIENVYDKAGSYAIQGPAKKYIEKIEGNYENVVGLPINLLERLFEELWEKILKTQSWELVY